MIAAHAIEPLPPGAVVPSLAALNIADVPARGAGDRPRRSARLGGAKPARVALVVPDTVAKVSLIQFEKVPAKAADLQELVRWQVRKSAPFPIEQAVVSVYARRAPRRRRPGVRRRRWRAPTSMQQYEQACAMAGVHAGLVDLATFSIINGMLAGQSAPAATGCWCTSTDTYTDAGRDSRRALMFFRNRGEESEGHARAI